MAGKYRMTISRLTVDKLGVRLYDKASAVIAEQVANSYDADAKKVEIIAPMGELLATKSAGVVKDKGLQIKIIDDGIGMTPEEVNSFYLKVGAERRKDPRRGDTSKIYGRKVMGRKGVGKLAPFGICQRIEILSSGGKPVKGEDEKGKSATGYLTAHLILDREKILEDVDTAYEPEVGEFDGIVRPKKGTTLTLTGFAHRRVPEIGDLQRQLAQRFGLRSPTWGVTLIDLLKTKKDADYSRTIGDFPIELMDSTRISFKEDGKTFGPDGEDIPDIKAGFDYGDKFFSVTGWVGYSKHPYKDDLMAGIRIYCRGKIATQTDVFNRKAGFTGEHSVRSYLVGELHADWLDANEDLIQTDRRDILWSDELGEAFERWGQKIIRKIGLLSRDPMRKRTWEIFQETSKLEAKIESTFPGEDQKEIREKAWELAKMVAQRIRPEELDDTEHVQYLVQLSLTLAPHITLDHKLREAAGEASSPLGVVTSILRTARVAELSSFGMIAHERVKVIRKIETLKDDSDTKEATFQELIEQTPWLIDPQWSPITANQSFNTLKDEFCTFFKKETGKEIRLGDFSEPEKRADFVLSNQDGVLQLIEIKRPGYKLSNTDMERIDTYVRVMDKFLKLQGHEEFRKIFHDFRVTLVCDGLSLKGMAETAFRGLIDGDRMTHITWKVFLLRTKRMHEEFLREADRQRRYAAKKK